MLSEPLLEAPAKDALARSTDVAPELLKRLVRDEVEAQLRKEHQILKESVAVATKIIGAAAALFLAVFTVFGITTWGDIKKEAVAVVKAQTEELIKKADSDANVKDNLTGLVNMATVASYLAATARNPAKSVVLPANDWERLQLWLKGENLPLDDFRDALAVLNAQETDRKSIDSNRFLAEMLNPPDKSPYSWIQRQPEKRQAILDVFKDKSLGSAAAEIVTSPALTESIRAAAAKYVQDVEFTEGVDRLLDSYARLKDGPAKRNTLVACLTLRPDHPGVVAAFKGLLAEPATSHGALLVGAALNALPNVRFSFSSEAERDTFRGLSKSLLTFAAKNGLFFSAYYFDTRSPFEMRDREADEPKAVHPTFAIMLSTSKEGSASGVGSLSIGQFREFESYWKLLAESANAGDLATVQALLPRKGSYFGGLTSRPVHYVVAMKASPGARIHVSIPGTSPTAIDVASLAGATISVTSSRGRPGLELSWTDGSGQMRTAAINKIEGTGYSFALQKDLKGVKS